MVNINCLSKDLHYMSLVCLISYIQSWIFEAEYWNFDYSYKSLEASVGYIVIIFIIFLIIFLIILTIFFNNIFSSFLAAFLYSKKGAKIEKRIHRNSIPCKNVKIMKKCSKNSVFFTIWISEFGASIFGRSNCPNISEFRIIWISGLQHCL